MHLALIDRERFSCELQNQFEAELLRPTVIGETALQLERQALEDYLADSEPEADEQNNVSLTIPTQRIGAILRHLDIRINSLRTEVGDVMDAARIMPERLPRQVSRLDAKASLIALRDQFEGFSKDDKKRPPRHADIF
jgi:hypothetical protein